jgi:carboxypeptidase C (cathepsin A)
MIATHHGVIHASPSLERDDSATLSRPPARVVAALLLAAFSLGRSTAAAQLGREPDHIVTTHHQITLAGRPLKYTARAGLMPIRDNETGDLHARMFFISYTLDSAGPRSRRPLTFVWNGGPGMNSSLIHLLGFGPRRVKTGDAYPTSPPISETDMEDNPDTWLDQTDLVFVDPVGTGFGRPTKPEYAGEFYEAIGDIESVTELIRLYRLRYDAMLAPLFIVGHSYGTTRAMGVADALERRGIPLKGVALLSGGIAVGQDPISPELTTALAVPGMTAAAFFHKKLSVDVRGDLQSALRQAETWAQNSYAPALARRETLSDAERERVRKELAHFIGIDPGAVDPKILSVTRDQFKTMLFGEEHRIFGNYDARMTRPWNPSEVGYDILNDPSFRPVVPLVQGTSPVLNRYLRSDLGFESDLIYQGPLGGGYPPDSLELRIRGLGIGLNHRFRRGPGGRGAGGSGGAATVVQQPPSPPPLRRALDANPTLQVFVGRGLYDSGSCFPVAYTISHLQPPLARRVTIACYGAGHDMYSDKEVRVQMKRDITAFIQKTLTGSR